MQYSLVRSRHFYETETFAKTRVLSYIAVIKPTASHQSFSPRLGVWRQKKLQEGLAVASIERYDPSTLPGDDPFPLARMHRYRNAR